MAEQHSRLLISTIELVHADRWIMECLRAAERLRLPDWYIAGGFLRNAIWDYLHEKQLRTPLNDVDVVYYDPADLRPDTERGLEATLQDDRPAVIWQVRNQARMHIPNGHAPYRDTQHAMAHWPEIPTCVGVRLDRGAIKIAAPFGIEANWSLQVRPNPLVRYAVSLYNDRIRNKRWLEHWPKLNVTWARDP
jgi:hypothetical protein